MLNSNQTEHVEVVDPIELAAAVAVAESVDSPEPVTEMCVKLHGQGKSFREISKLMTKAGYPISHEAVRRKLIKSGKVTLTLNRIRLVPELVDEKMVGFAEAFFYGKELVSLERFDCRFLERYADEIIALVEMGISRSTICERLEIAGRSISRATLWRTLSGLKSAADSGRTQAAIGYFLSLQGSSSEKMRVQDEAKQVVPVQEMKAPSETVARPIQQVSQVKAVSQLATPISKPGNPAPKPVVKKPTVELVPFDYENPPPLTPIEGEDEEITHNLLLQGVTMSFGEFRRRMYETLTLNEGRNAGIFQYTVPGQERPLRFSVKTWILEALVLGKCNSFKKLRAAVNSQYEVRNWDTLVVGDGY